MPNSHHKATDQEFIDAIKSSFSIAEVLRKLGLCMYGSSYREFKIRRQNLNADTSHFTGQGHLKGKTNPGRGRPLEELLVKDSNKILGRSCKNRILKAKLLDNKCAICGLADTWQDKPIVLHIDHINGDPFDHRIENLRILCPNCHSQTNTYGSKNKSGTKQKRSTREIRKRERVVHLCVFCSSPTTARTHQHCWKCYCTRRKEIQSPYKQKTKIEWPPLDKLLEMLSKSNFLQVGKKLGISDNAIRKHIKKHSPPKQVKTETNALVG